MTTTTLGTAAAGYRHHPLSCFAAGFIAVLVFHQGAWAILHAFGAFPPPFPYQASQPFGVPMIWSYAFWGGIWGLVYGAVERYFPQGVMYYVTAFLFGAILTDLVLWFVVFPLKGQPMAAGWNVIEMLKHFFLHGCFGLGIGLLLTYRDGRLRMLRR
jgi:hypothetical protein